MIYIICILWYTQTWIKGWHVLALLFCSQQFFVFDKKLWQVVGQTWTDFGATLVLIPSASRFIDSFLHFAALKNIKRSPHQSEKLSLCVSFFFFLLDFYSLTFPLCLKRALKNPEWPGRVHLIYPAVFPSMAHFHKSHVSVFAARETLTRGCSPNRVHKKPENTSDTQRWPAPPPHLSTQRAGRKISCGDSRGMFCHLKSTFERKVCVCVCVQRVCVIDFLTLDHMHSSEREGLRVQLKSAPLSLFIVSSTHTCPQESWGKSWPITRATARATAIVSMEMAT